MSVEIKDRGAGVTGGASGIGRSLCLALAQHGAALGGSGVARPGAAQVAADIAGRGQTALAVTADVSSEPDVQALVTQAEQAFGRIDLVFSNAGIIVAGGIEVPDEAWSRIWAINVQSHIYLARAVLPGMLARGEGYLVITASAAGLLTQLGSAPYAVTKHAAGALAEWLSLSYGDRGIGVSCLCPQAVTTHLAPPSLREVAGLVPAPADTGAIPAAAGKRSGSPQGAGGRPPDPRPVPASGPAPPGRPRFPSPH